MPAYLLILLLAAPSENLERYSRSEPHLGSTVSVTLYASSATEAEAGLLAAFAEVERLNGILSDYEPESELSRLSAASPTAEPVELSRELATVLRAAEGFSEKSEGAFDVTIGPLSTLWRRARRRREMPEAEALRTARAAVGHHHVKLCEVEGRTLATLDVPGMRLDLGGIAKGYIADEVLRLLAARGLPRAMVNAGGDMALGDAPPNEKGWLIGIAPLEADAPPGTWIAAGKCGVATSGDAFQFVELEGVRYSHILDPKTGLGVVARSSVTVIAPRGIDADALASAVSVLGPEKGMALVEQSAGVEALIVYPHGDRILTKQSRGFSKFITAAPAGF